jgi:CheY-like chemotaxis protein
MKFLKTLIVEDSEDDVLILLRHLARGGYEIEYQCVQTAREMQEALHSNDWQIVLSDYSMPQFDGLMALSVLKKTGIDIPFIIISGTLGEDTAVQTMLAGVDDYFVKGNLNRLIPAIEREIKECENRHARRRAESQLEEHKKRLQLALNAAGMGVWDWTTMMFIGRPNVMKFSEQKISMVNWKVLKKCFIPKIGSWFWKRHFLLLNPTILINRNFVP